MRPQKKKKHFYYDELIHIYTGLAGHIIKKYTFYILYTG